MYPPAKRLFILIIVLCDGRPEKISAEKAINETMRATSNEIKKAIGPNTIQAINKHDHGAYHLLS